MKIKTLSFFVSLVLVWTSGCTPPVPKIKQLSVGENHACSLDNKISGVVCWGDNSSGQTNIPWLSNPKWITTGSEFSCAIDDTGVVCWGQNDQGQIDVPTDLLSPRAVTAGVDHACALDATGVRCWGSDSDGQLTSMPQIVGVKSIQAGGYHTCVIDSEGVKCWGRSDEGQLSVPVLSAPSLLASGGYHSCVVDAGDIKCWGGNAALNSDIPAVTLPSKLSAGAFHSCVIDISGVECWGGTSGDAVLTPRNLTLPKDIAVGGVSASLSGGEAFACSRHLQGVSCWGDNSVGQIDYNGQPFHVLYHSESLINVPAADVWAVLMDLDSYPQWNPFTIAMQSTLQVGGAMNMSVYMVEQDLVLAQTEYIRVIDHADQKVCWGINTNTPEFNSGERCQWLEVVSANQTRYITEDLIEGTGNSVVSGSVGGSVKAGFDGVAAQLKIRVEALYPQ